MAVLPRRHPESDFSLVMEVEPVPEAVPQARRAVAAVLVSWGLSDICDDAVLCLSEAVTNALTHARPSRTVIVRVYRDYRALRIEIADADGRMIPRQRSEAESDPRAPLPSEHGWGLRIVDALSARWGTVADHTGKRVWLELDIPAAGQPPEAREGQGVS